MSVKIDYAELDESVFQNYFQYMIGKIYKILPMKEEGCKTLTSYLESLKIEMIGSYGLYRQLMEEPQFIMNCGFFYASRAASDRGCPCFISG